jgi:hypothetical protein
MRHGRPTFVGSVAVADDDLQRTASATGRSRAPRSGRLARPPGLLAQKLRQVFDAVDDVRLLGRRSRFPFQT